ncbi:hypothetical protein AKJ16_DCAP10592 [Drosera capensis]
MGSDEPRKPLVEAAKMDKLFVAREARPPPTQARTYTSPPSPIRTLATTEDPARAGTPPTIRTFTREIASELRSPQSSSRIVEVLPLDLAANLSVVRPEVNHEFLATPDALRRMWSSTWSSTARGGALDATI